MTARVAEAETQSLVEELGRLVTGEVRFDKMTRLLYSTDASIYQIEPIGVVIPKTAEDVIAVVETPNRHGVPVLPRGGGTSLAGQTVGRAIVIDFSKYMHDVIEVNAEEGWVRAQPGIILDELNHHLAPHGVLFAPDPSTSNRGNVGGAVGNNSCGAHSILWGKTVDNVRELDVVLSNYDVAQPAILFVSNARSDIVTEGNIQGAPDLVVEILSPNTAVYDRGYKVALYSRHGVREYWLVDPDAETVEVLVLGEGGLSPHQVFGTGQTLESPLLEGLSLKLEDLFRGDEL